MISFNLRLKSILTISLFIFLGSTVLFSQKKVVGYYYPPAVYSVLTVNNFEFSNLTHINHAFVWPSLSGEIITDNGVLYPELIDEAHKAGKKILISMGGWGQSDNFAPVTADSALRSRFVQNIFDFVIKNGYDGIDIDWEFPADFVQSRNLTSLVKEIRTIFSTVNTPLLITMAVTSSDWNGKYFEFSKLTNYVDWFNLMTYDFHGTWTNHAGHNAPLYSSSTDYDGSCGEGVKYLNTTRGIPKQKIMLGVPFYGKEFNAKGLYMASTGAVTDLKYTDVVNRLASGQWQFYWDNISRVPYLLNNEQTKFVTYDDTLSIRLKGEYVQKNDLGGIMIWALGQDVVSGGQPLLETIGKTMGLLQTSARSYDRLIADDFNLYNNYPNPFNPSTVIKFSIPRTGIVRLIIYNSLGQKISVLADKEMSAGTYEFRFDAAGLPGGIYFCQMHSGEFSKAVKMILVK